MAWAAEPAPAPAIAEADPAPAAEPPAEPAALPDEPASAPEQRRRRFLAGGGRLLLTGGVSTFEGAGGGGIVPWALIGSYGTRNELGVSAFGTGVLTQDFTLAAYGGAVSYKNRIELSVARQNFNLRNVGLVLGLGNRYTISQTIIGAKVRLVGDAVLDQDRLLPQISAGIQYKINDDRGVVGGALPVNRQGVDFYLAATKIILSQSVLLNATVRLTKANQFGILGFGGLNGARNEYQPQFEGSVAYLITRKLAIGGEYRTKSNRLEGALGGTSFREENAYDFFVAYAPIRNVSFTLAYARLGQIALTRQNGVYGSLQLSF
ncbi:MAG: DUF3034 family protein [Sphingomonas sp.]|nr:DUF3034 family protein [Sphingomonas sp.]